MSLYSLAFITVAFCPDKSQHPSDSGSCGLDLVRVNNDEEIHRLNHFAFVPCRKQLTNDSRRLMHCFDKAHCLNIVFFGKLKLAHHFRCRGFFLRLLDRSNLLPFCHSYWGLVTLELGRIIQEIAIHPLSTVCGLSQTWRVWWRLQSI